MKNKKYLCACGGKCEGICMELHLYRKRDWADKCPAAYERKKYDKKM